MAQSTCLNTMKHAATTGSHGYGRRVKTRTFTEMAGATEHDSVWFSFIVFKSKEHRDEVNAKVNEEMSQLGDMTDFAMPFDMSKMAYGGFLAEVEG